MKKVILIVCAAAALAGCNRNQGGTSDQYGTDRGSMTNAPGSSSSSVTPSANTFGTDTNSQGGTTSQGGTSRGSSSSSESKTNSSSNP